MSTVLPVIAVVDDEEPVRKALERLLRSSGYEVETFDSGSAFLQAAEERMPDCLVLDVHMPRMSGFDVQARLAATRADLPIIIITGHDSPEAEMRALRSGAVAYLRKPVSDHALIEAITSATAREPGSP